MPVIPHRKVVSAKLLLSETPVLFKQTTRQLVLTLPPPALIKDDLVIALTMDKSLDGIVMAAGPMPSPDDSLIDH